MLPHPAAFGPAAPVSAESADFPPVLRLLTYNLFLRRLDSRDRWYMLLVVHGLV